MNPDKQPHPKVELTTNSILTVALAVALAVSMCPRRGNNTDQELRELRTAVERLEKKVDALAAAEPKRAPSSGTGQTARPTPSEEIHDQDIRKHRTQP